MQRSYNRPTGGLRCAATPGYILATLRVEDASYAGTKSYMNENPGSAVVKETFD